MRRKLWLGGVAVGLVLGGTSAVSCSDSSENKKPTTSSGGGGAAGGTTSTGGSGGDLFPDGGSDCPIGQPCDEDAVCTENDVCCPNDLACGDHCCSDTAICSFQQCAEPGDECVDSSDCLPGEYCEHALGEPTGEGGGGVGGGCQGGVELLGGRCLPRPPECGPNEQPSDPPTCLQKCEYVPPFSAFDPVVKYTWGGQITPPTATDVMMTPIVVQLDDDDCDGKVTARDIPEIVFSTFTSGGYYRPGTLHAISVVGGQVVEKWTLPDSVQASTGLAAADLDGDGVPEVVGCDAPVPGGVSCCDAQAQNTGVNAYRADGALMWEQLDTSRVHCGYESPAIANPDGTGPKVLVGWTILDGGTGNIVMELDPASSYGATLSGWADLDGDNILDVVDGQRAYRIDGTPLWDLRNGPDAITRGYHAIGDLDNDGTPEVVVISSGGPHTAFVLRYDPNSPSGAEVIRRDIDINDGISTMSFCGSVSEYGGGPPTIADFNGDGFPDVGAAGAVGYIVLDGQKLMDPNLGNDETTLWFKTTQDCSSAVTGSSVFDFNGDGAAEVVYSDEIHLWMYDGTTGTNLIPDTCNTSGTLWEYPVIADVDNDGQADIVIPSNAYSSLSCAGGKQSGITIFGSATSSWVRTRRVWNQHTYHVSNIAEDGSVPSPEMENWLTPGLNNYRQNKQPGGEFSAPDLIVSVVPKCVGEYGLVARVRNIGEAAVPPGVMVGFYLGNAPSGTKLGEAATTQWLFSLGSEDVLLPLANEPGGFVSALVDDGGPPHQWVECRTDNNGSEAADPSCGPN